MARAHGGVAECCSFSEVYARRTDTDLARTGMGGVASAKILTRACMKPDGIRPISGTDSAAECVATPRNLKWSHHEAEQPACGPSATRIRIDSNQRVAFGELRAVAARAMERCSVSAAACSNQPFGYLSDPLAGFLTIHRLFSERRRNHQVQALSSGPPRVRGAWLVSARGAPT
jgi:hypothetical protein